MTSTIWLDIIGSCFEKVKIFMRKYFLFVIMFLYSWSTFFYIHAQIFKPYMLLNCCHFSSFLKLTKQNLNSTVSWGVIVYNLGYSKDLGSSKLCTRKLHIAAIQFQNCWSCRRMVFFAIFYESRLIIYYIKRFHTYQSLLQILLLPI